MGFLLCRKGLVGSVIKQFIDTVNDAALKAMLKYIDDENDDRENEIEKLEEEIEKIKHNQSTFEDTKKVVEAYTNLSKVVKKSIVTAIITGVIGWILIQIGIGGG